MSPVIIESIESAVLRGNPLGDPHVRAVPVYLPPGYAETNDRYPTAYVLTGYTGQGRMLLNESAWSETLPQRLDRLMASGQVRPMIVVMPDCMTKYGGSQYINSSATGRYEDHVTQELAPFIEQKYLSEFPQPPPRPPEWMDVIGILAMAACYSANPASPLGFDLPFDEYTCELDEAVWGRWLEHDPLYLLPGHAEALRSLRLLFLDCGTRDEFRLLYGARAFDRRLKELGISHHYEEFDDGHMNIQYRYDVSFSMISAAMTA